MKIKRSTIEEISGKRGFLYVTIYFFEQFTETVHKKVKKDLRKPKP